LCWLARCAAVAIIDRFQKQEPANTVKILALLPALASLLLAACPAPSETVSERPAMKCDVSEPSTGSRIARKENCVRDTRAQ